MLGLPNNGVLILLERVEGIERRYHQQHRQQDNEQTLCGQLYALFRLGRRAAAVAAVVGKIHICPLSCLCDCLYFDYTVSLPVR